MTEAICYRHAYASRTDTIVRAVDVSGSPDSGPMIVLDQTVFYPGGGGQPADRGVLLCASDWARRHAMMRTHTALHALCGVVWRDYGALVTGGNMEPGNGRMDFEFETNER